MVQFFRRRLLERPHIHALRIHSRHDVLDRSIFPGRIHGLKNQQQAPAVLRRENVLQMAQFLDAVRQQFLRLRLQFRLQPVRVGGVVILEAEVFSVFDAVAPEQFVDFHSVTLCDFP